MLAAADDSVFVNFYFVGDTERHDFIAYANTEAWEVVALAFAPLEVDVLEGLKFSSLTYIQLDIHEPTTNGAIDAVLRDDDSSLEIQFLAQGALPQADCNGIR